MGEANSNAVFRQRLTMCPPQMHIYMYSQTGRPSLKELCPEDKCRVRLLIEQLARTSCEKEAMEDQVKKERKQFAILLEKLKEEHHKVVQEKKDILFTSLEQSSCFLFKSHSIAN